jgi:hypothetical protein
MGKAYFEFPHYSFLKELRDWELPQELSKA